MKITLLVIGEKLPAVHILVFDRWSYPGEAFSFRVSVGGIVEFTAVIFSSSLPVVSFWIFMEME